VNLLSYRKYRAEDVKLHHRNLHNAIRKGEALNCDSTLGYYGVVAPAWAFSPARKSVLKWILWREG
jgi:hypothetical protein